MSIEGLLVGRVLGGRYRIEEVIGRGGMGAVYRALDERLGRAVALKVITVSGPGDAESRKRLRARFFREARSAAALPHHPNVVPVYDYGSDEELGLDYLVMELLRGSDLASRLSRTGPPPLAASLKILLEASRGIAVGHRQGLIHRDVKPGNIFLTEPRSNEVQVRVVDFGIAKLADDDDTLGQLTQDGRVPHSPAYASPEQLRGLSNLTPASDVFSLGAVGYQLMTGERPFTEEDRNRMQLGMAVEPRAARELNPAIPGSIEAVILRALNTDPQRRYKDADELTAELDRAMRLMADEPVEPYLPAAATVTSEGPGVKPEAAERNVSQLEEDDDDRTQLVFDEDDRTLLAPPPPPTPTGPPDRPADARRTPPSRVERKKPRVAPSPPVKPQQKRRAGGIVVWTVVVLALLVAAMWILNEITSFDRGPSLADQLRDSVPSTEPDTPDVFVPPVPSDEMRAQQLDILGRQSYRAGRFTDAVEYQREAVQLDPDVYEYRRNFGLTLLAIGDAEGAEEQFQDAIALNRDVSPAYFDLHRSQVALGDTLGAINALEAYLAREKGSANRAEAARRLAELQASQSPNAPPLLGEPLSSGPGPSAPPSSEGLRSESRSGAAAPAPNQPQSLTTASASPGGVGAERQGPRRPVSVALR